ncbi:Tol-Pal system beta propeller repeat protein TolB [Legionella londiniensis]|uniref:Tol-Pal system protein TolB n=1 Tax=Legionella londiniensis TaxID=45068 RepID=A0A0W0VM18_9GAMM|nr:Tol-Pal system beta propeller repeat protein TolB [Legionella londiniensis]KTD21162.1 TolB protein [Legionella londiniensis]STX93184.1 TolB colicin import protein [Legionella londiniensis]
MLKHFIVISLFFLSKTLFALDLELTQGINAAMPIAINPFSGGENAIKLQEIIRNDLRLSGQFKIISSPGILESAPVAFWRKAGADSVLSGNVSQVGFNRFDVRFELSDAAAQGKLLLAKSYTVNGSDLRALAHHISDEVYQKLTGERGVFSTRIAYVLVKNQGQKTRHSLEVADMDGHNPQSLLISSEPIMSPSWSPDGRHIAFVSFERKKAQIFVVEVASGKRRLITDFPGINGAPAWSPDGKELAVVLSKNGAPKIYSINLSTGAMKQLTFGNSIDTEPRYAPDGKSLLFTSGRGGAPQVYSLSLNDGAIRRVTFEGNYNARASYTPNQKQIVMLHREDSHFNIGVQDTRTGHISQLTFSNMDESPSVAPNGRLIVYATTFQQKGVLAVVSIDGRIRMRLPSPEGSVQEPAWSPFLV